MIAKAKMLFRRYMLLVTLNVEKLLKHFTKKIARNKSKRI